jgi:hypothetical protein
MQNSSSTEAVQGTTRPLESVDNIKSGDSFPLSVFCVSHRVANDLKRMMRGGYKDREWTSYILKEDLENTTSLLIDQARDTLDTTTTCETTNGWLGDTCAI